ncbi:hypothetical protein Vadar_008497 [Vaccinium darrowii]|uniref:Uncharacterized protein n=1 Tax=Vaccinium darrowii TaxID=229202 RepID=A0ACB7Z3W0_9ERIC|nr:hypothetical protein Vadar_008497 [Vaccinium darrowii]
MTNSGARPEGKKKGKFVGRPENSNHRQNPLYHYPASTHDQYVFSFCQENRYCHGFEEALARYREIVPYIKLSGPTSFAPVIDAAIDIVEKSNGQYHVLVIIADGQACPICLTNSKDMAFGCGHLTCKDCGVTISQCPMCRKPITTRLRLYS